MNFSAYAITAVGCSMNTTMPVMSTSPFVRGVHTIMSLAKNAGITSVRAKPLCKSFISFLFLIKSSKIFDIVLISNDERDIFSLFLVIGKF